MAIGAFVESAQADGGEGYSGRVTPFVVLSCVVAGSGGLLFGYDLGISGQSRLCWFLTISAAISTLS